MVVGQEAQSKVQEEAGLWACVTKLCRDDDDTAPDGTKKPAGALWEAELEEPTFVCP